MRLALLLLTIQLYSLPGSCQIDWHSTALNGLNVTARMNHHDPNRSDLLIDRKSTRLTLNKSRIIIGETAWEITQRAKVLDKYDRFEVAVIFKWANIQSLYNELTELRIAHFKPVVKADNAEVFVLDHIVTKVSKMNKKERDRMHL